MTEKNRNLDGLSPQQKDRHDKLEAAGGPKGLYNQFLIEPVPEYAKAGSEVVYQGHNNSFIVLGRDRPGLPNSGVGGTGGTQCGMIDLIAGLDSAAQKEKWNNNSDADKAAVGVSSGTAPGGMKATSPSFHRDAARVYLTQRGDIDRYLGLAKGSERAGSSKNTSAAAIKADNVRIVSRNHIKLVTGKARLSGGGDSGEKLSNGGDMDYAGKIDFIAGNNTDSEGIKGLSFFGVDLGEGMSSFLGIKPVKKLQPLVKGDNLIDFLNEFIEIIEELMDMISANNNNCLQLASALSSHVHEFGGILGSPTGPPVATAASIVPVSTRGMKNTSDQVITSFNLGMIKLNYLTSFMPTYINSRFVNTT